MIVKICIQNDWPILLGTTMKSIIDSGVQVPQDIFLDFVMYLEQCKGFEEDAKRFLFLCADLDYMKLDYSLLRPLFVRTIKMKKANDVLQLFEQSRKKI